MLRRDLLIEVGEIVTRDRFVFADLPAVMSTADGQATIQVMSFLW